MDIKTETLDTKSISIDPRVSLGEAMLLSEHFRNRSLILAQTLFETDLKVAELQKQVAEMSATIEAQATDLAAFRPAAIASEGTN